VLSALRHENLCILRATLKKGKKKMKDSTKKSLLENPPRHEDLRDWIEQVREMEMLKEIPGASWDLEVGVLTDLNVKSRKWTLLFDQIEDYPAGYRLLTGCLIDAGRVALTLGLSPELNDLQLVAALRPKLGQVDSNLDRFPVVEVSAAPFLKNRRQGSEVNIKAFPSMMWHEKDGGRYLGTVDAVVTRDPDSDWVNVGTYRLMVHDEQHLGTHINVSHHARLHAEKYWARGEDCPVAISLGHHPLISLLASMEVPAGVCEYDYAGSLTGSRYPVVKGPVTGLPVPADSEIVMEGYLTRELRNEGPFGEFMGYYAGGTIKNPVIKVEAVYFRDDPIILGAAGGRPPYDYSYYRCPLRAAMLWNALEAAGVSGIKGVWCHEAGYSRALTVLALEQAYMGHAEQVGHLAAQLPEGVFGGKYVVVVDADIDPSDTDQVLWAICSRTDPAENIEFIRNSWGMNLDPMVKMKPDSRLGELRMSRAIINACRPFDRAIRGDFPEVVEPSPEMKEKVHAKWKDILE
jgi:UbiD family decarboxylase